MPDFEDKESTALADQSVVEKISSDWNVKEIEYLRKISELERSYDKEKLQATINTLTRELQVRTEERENYKNKLRLLEDELKTLKTKTPEQIEFENCNDAARYKHLSETMLNKAKEIIYDKTKVCKNQELQIEALTQQVASLKEVVVITKDLLDIRNMEVKHLHEKMECVEQKIGIEKGRNSLMNQKLEAMISLNMELKKEYETQLALFKELQSRYQDHMQLQRA